MEKRTSRPRAVGAGPPLVALRPVTMANRRELDDIDPMLAHRRVEAVAPHEDPVPGSDVGTW